MNFPKALLLGAIAALVIGSIVYFTRTDRTDPVAVATDFTSALNGEDINEASQYFDPARAEEWKTQAEKTLYDMGSGQHGRFFERIPDDPAFGQPQTATNGVTTITSADNTLTLNLKQIDGDWYVTRAPI